MSNRWPTKKRSYHAGRKRCRYLKDMQKLRAKGVVIRRGHEIEAGTVEKANLSGGADKPRALGPSKRKRKGRFRDHLGRVHKAA